MYICNANSDLETMQRKIVSENLQRCEQNGIWPQMALSSISYLLARAQFLKQNSVPELAKPELSQVVFCKKTL
jgi:hypothetical protein